MLVKLDHFPRDRDEHKKMFELPPPKEVIAPQKTNLNPSSTRHFTYGRKSTFCKGWKSMSIFHRCQLQKAQESLKLGTPVFLLQTVKRDISQNAPEWGLESLYAWLENWWLEHVAETYARSHFGAYGKCLKWQLDVLSKNKPWKDRSWFFHTNRFDFRDKDVNQLFLYVRQFGCGTNDMVVTWEKIIIQTGQQKAGRCYSWGFPAIYIYISSTDFPQSRSKKTNDFCLWDEGMILSIFTESTCLLVRGEKLTRYVGI